ncbi:MAG: hypothetical protein JWM04_1589 [Verrucomicrobiales bacterium]|nr:hypothetical protein [Verrucomicrobiales bacterium]
MLLPASLGNRLQSSSWILLLILSIFLCSCNKHEDLLLNGNIGQVDLGPFLFKQITRYGGPSITNNYFAGITNFTFLEGDDGFKIICEGNHAEKIKKMLEPQYGPPSGFGKQSAFAYYFPKSSMGLQCVTDLDNRDGKQVQLTQIVVVSGHLPHK